MFGLKLVGAVHPEFPFFGRAGNPAVMNFPNSPEGRRIAASVPIGHRSLVYLMSPVKHFWTAIEYVKLDPSVNDLLEEGTRAAESQNAVALVEALNPKFAKLWRCIRVIALIDNPQQAPTPDFGFQEGDIMFDVTQQEYSELFSAIPWSWTEEAQ
jgi:hypothetical protein